MKSSAWRNLVGKRAPCSLLLTVALAAGPSAYSDVNVSELMGRHRSELTSVFPGAGRIIRNWQGWTQAALFTNRHGELVALRLESAGPVTERQAEEAVRQLGISLDTGRYFATPTESGYSDMPGPVRTVTFTRSGERVMAIGIFSRFADGS